MRVFIDTNLWVYRLDRHEPAKSEQIRPWLATVICEHEVVLSTQVLIELRAVSTRKLQPPLSDSQIWMPTSWPTLNSSVGLMR